MGKFSGPGRVGHPVSRAMGQQQRTVTEHGDRLPRRQPRGKYRQTVHAQAVTALAICPVHAAVIGNSQRHPAAHGMPDQADGQVAKPSGNLIEGPARIRNW